MKTIRFLGHQEVSNVTLLFLCKTQALKLLECYYNESVNMWVVELGISLGEEPPTLFYCAYKSEEKAKELNNQCVEWLNY